MKGKSILVTGGAGFIGSHLVRALIDGCTRVRVLDNLSTGRIEKLEGFENSLDFHEADVRDAVACRKACRGIDTIFHLAAYISVPGSIRDPVTADAVNIGGTLNLLMAACELDVKRFVLSSSAAVYGDTDVVPSHEGIVPRPVSPYGLEKVYGEHIARIYHTLYGIGAVSLRYFNVYGPGQDPRSEYAAVIPRFITTILDGRQPTIFGDGEQTRDFLFVEDVVQANLKAAQSEKAAGEVYNIAGGFPISLNALVVALSAITRSEISPIYAPERAGDIKHSCADISRARQALGFSPGFDLKTGLERTVAYYQSE